MLSKVPVDEVFMLYCEKMLSASRGLAPVPYRGSAPGLPWDFHPLDFPHCPPLEKILRARVTMVPPMSEIRRDNIWKTKNNESIRR